MKICFFFTLLLVASLVQAQPTINWAHNFDGSDLEYNYANLNDDANGYLAVVNTLSTEGDIALNYGAFDF